ADLEQQRQPVPGHGGAARQGLVPRLPDGALDVDVVAWRFLAPAGVPPGELEEELRAAAPEDVPRAECPVAADPRAVDEGAVAAPQVAHHPAVAAPDDLGVLPADGRVPQHDLQGLEAADAQPVLRLPGPPPQFGADTPQTDLLFLQGHTPSAW